MSTGSSSLPARSESAMFVLSCARSGSTLLRFILDSHPRICCPSEIESGLLCDKLGIAVSRTIAAADVSAGPADRASRTLAETRTIVGGLLRRYADLHGKEFWCEKSPSNVDHLALLTRVFPHARYICLFRNCMDVVHSHMTSYPARVAPWVLPHVQSRYPGWVVPAIVEYWLAHTQRMLDFMDANPSQCHLIRYTDVVERPEPTLSALFGFLGVEWEPALVDTVFQRRREDPGGGDPKIWFTTQIRKDSVGKGVAVPSAEIDDDYRRRIDVLHARLGYPSLHQYFDAPRSASKDVSIGQTLDFQEVEALVNGRRAQLASLGSGCRLVVTGLGSWALGSPESSVNDICTITIDAGLLADIRGGRVNPVEAFYDGRVGINGSVELAKYVAKELLG